MGLLYENPKSSNDIERQLEAVDESYFGPLNDLPTWAEAKRPTLGVLLAPQYYVLGKMMRGKVGRINDSNPIRVALMPDLPLAVVDFSWKPRLADRPVMELLANIGMPRPVVREVVSTADARGDCNPIKLGRHAAGLAIWRVLEDLPPTNAQADFSNALLPAAIIPPRTPWHDVTE